MARGKKKENALTPEEKLAQAMVPDWEQPYRVPSNWCWVSLESVASLHNGDRGVNYPSKRDYVDIGIPFINAGAIQNNALNESEFNYITEEKFESLRAGKIQKGDILYCLRGSLGKTAIVENDARGAISSSLCILRCNEAVLRQYFAYLLQSDVIHKQQDLAENGSAQPNLSAASVLKYMLPVPPFTEQQRIVDRIEYLFAKLDEAKEKAQSVLDRFEIRKAAILQKAFTGELTAKWRELSGVEAKSRITAKMGDIVKLLSGQDFKSEDYNSNGDGIPYITGASNFDNDHVIINRWTSAPTVVAQRADVLLVCKGSGFGKVIIADFETAHIARQIMALRVKEGIDSRFIYYFLQSEYDYLRSNGQGLIPGISRSVVINLPINLPIFREQIEIVHILDSLFAKEQQAKEAVEAVLKKIDLLKKSILARAFRGELGTNDPSEESVLEVLKSILGLPVEDKSPVKRVFIPHDLENRINTDLERKIVKLFLQKNVDSMPVSRLMSVSSEKFDVMAALRNLQKRGVLAKEKERYILLR